MPTERPARRPALLLTALALAQLTIGIDYLASGIATSGQQVGGAVGLAVLVAIANAVAGVGSGPAPTGAALADGLRAAMAVAALLMLLGVGVAALLARRSAVPAEPSAADRATPVRCS